jgi:DNA-binding CsgD family transcriptional regulator
MDSLALACYLASVMACVFSFGVFSFLAFSYRRPFLKAYLLYLAAMLAQVTLALVGQVVYLVKANQVPDLVRDWLQLPGFLVVAAFTVTAPRFYLAFAETPYPAPMRVFLDSLAGLTVLLSPLSFLPQSQPWFKYLPGIVELFGFLTAIFYGQIKLISAYERLHDRLYRVGIPLIVVNAVICTLGSIIDSSVGQVQIASGQYPHGILFQPIAYTFWNALTLVWAIKSHRSGFFLKRANPAFDPERIRAFGLSEREVELAILVAEGAANKEISGRLGISANTVRNHLHHVFEKTGARNRVELLRLLLLGGE